MNSLTSINIYEIYYPFLEEIDKIPDEIDSFRTLFRVIKSHGKINSYSLIFNLQIDGIYYNKFIELMKSIYNEKLLDLFIYYNYLKNSDIRYKNINIESTFHQYYYYGMSSLDDKEFEHKMLYNEDEDSMYNFLIYMLGAFSSNNTEKIEKDIKVLRSFNKEDYYNLYLENKELFHKYIGNYVPKKPDQTFSIENDFEIEKRIFNFDFSNIDMTTLIMVMKLDAKLYFQEALIINNQFKQNLKSYYKIIAKKFDSYYLKLIDIYLQST
jgi:hypothetical protein